MIQSESLKTVRHLLAGSILRLDRLINCQLLAAGCLLINALCALVFKKIAMILLLAQMFFHQAGEEINQIFNL
jgi:hypothetical protein